MNIDQTVPLVERIVAEQREGNLSFFSYRHAEEMHALGFKHEFPAGSPWSQVCISVVISVVFSPKIWVQIYWSRPKLEYPKKELESWEFPLSEEGVRMFTEAWPAIRQQLAHAIERGRPPEIS